MQTLPDSGPGSYGSPSTPLPLMASYQSDPAEMDYSAYLQGPLEMDDFADWSSGSAMTPQLPSTSPSAATLSDSSALPLAPRPPPLAAPTALTVRGHNHAANRKPSSSPEVQVGQLRPRLERRGHTKSRRGCFNCKRRRIKCQETRPACGHCVKQGLKCEYPALPTIVHQPQHQIPLFSLQDMRFFQHFLLNCYPHHPIGSEDLWTHEIPCLSQKHDYLMHAILGYAASDLLDSDPSLAEAAMSHRLKAIKAIKKTLAASASSSYSYCSSYSSSSSIASPSSSTDVQQQQQQQPPQQNRGPRDGMYEEGNALMATCFALTYQSVLLGDGMAEYMTFIRGVVIVAVQMYVAGARILFGPMLDDGRNKEKLEPHMRGLPLLERAWTDAAVASLEGLAPLVVGRDDDRGGGGGGGGAGVGGERETERRYWELLLEMARRLYESSWRAYLGLSDLYGWWMMLPHQQFRRLVDPDNQVAILLGAHWIAMEQIMAVICQEEQKAAAKTPGRDSGSGIRMGSIGWLKHLNAQVDEEHRPYNRWPAWVEAQLDRDRGYFGRTC